MASVGSLTDMSRGLKHSGTESTEKSLYQSSVFSVPLCFKSQEQNIHTNRLQLEV